MKHPVFRLILVSLFMVCCHSYVRAQQLPKNPDPNKCYVRVVTLDEYVYTYEDYLTYTPEEAALHPHQELELIISPAYKQWETTMYEGCESDDPNDCQVLCYKSYPAKVITIYDPINDTIGSPHWVEVEFKEVITKGGLTSYEEIDCALTSFNEIPLTWYAEELATLSPQDELILDDMIVDLLRYKDDIRIQIDVHTSTEGMEAELQDISSKRATSILNYLQDQFINTDRVVTRTWGGTQPIKDCGNPVPCTNRQNAQNERVLFRVLNIDN